jgi:tetratricopeptide (TPR) repeat protein
MTAPRLFLVAVFVAGGLFAADKPAVKTPPALAEARARRLKGNTDEARAAYAKAAADPKLRAAATVGLAKCQRDVGEYAAALKTLADAATADPKAAALLAEQSDLLYFLGRWDEADAAAKAALAADSQNLLAKWTAARVLGDRGDLTGADLATRGIVRYYTARSNADRDITDPDELLVVAQAGAENARRNNLAKQFAFILNEVLADALKAEPDFWPAEVMAGDMLLEKYNRPTAVEAYDKALTIHPKCAEALVGKARAALTRFDIKEAEAFADKAIEANPHHPGALQTLAAIDVMAGDWAGAEKRLAAARAVNPRDPVTLGKLAAVYRLQNKLPPFDAVVKAAQGFDAKPAAFYSELGDTLEERKRYGLASAYFEKAIAARANFAPPRTSLGMLQLRLGREAVGRDLLTKAFADDPFNVRTANTLKVLKHLDGYATIETPHYTLRYDRGRDRVLAETVAEYLEETHAELKRQFDYEPPDKVLLEIFNSHDMFSGRTTGLPDLHTIGACTGRVVVMASPAATGVRKPFHWGRVIRHELTHIFNLVQTDYQCPHWLTEGLAVRNEQMATPPSWLVTLRDRFDAGTLFNLDTVLYGFVRPKSQDEWGLAYCQSRLYVDYLVATHGEGTIAKLLAAYTKGMLTAEAIPAACGVSQADFEAGYRKHVAAVVKPYARKGPAERVTKPLTFDELTKLHDAEPENAEIAAQLAEALLRREQAGEAKKLAEEVLARDPASVPAALVKVSLLRRGGDDAEAATFLEGVLAKHPADPRLLVALARLCTQAKEYDKAAELLERGRKAAPLDGDWLGQLATLYRLSENPEKLAGVLREVIAQDPDDLAARLSLAKSALDARDYPRAEAAARDALQIDVMNPEARATLIEALAAQKKSAEVEKVERRYVVD